jgi:hypothetical protein
MRVFMFLATLMVGSLLTGCVIEDVQKLKNDSRLLRDYLKAFPVPTHCSQPGRDQDIVCNYKLVIWNVGGEVYRGHIDPDLVKEGIKACEKYRESHSDETNKNYDKDLVMIMKHNECQKFEDYRFNVYELRIAGPTIPESDNPVDLVNVPHGPYMKKGHIGEDSATHLPIAR